MSYQLDPFLIPIPQKWNKDPELSPAVNYLWKWLHDAYKRLGGPSDAISDLQDSTDHSLESRIARLESIVESLTRENENLSRVVALERAVNGLLTETAIPKPDQKLEDVFHDTLVYSLLDRIKSIEAQL